ncbi:hypothetical protein I79_012299 [Cricetulus griseus]|uniref:Uncharacterized protein n=1 Tax=Cricetulus griseus TaxID=10029 RepID=G3HNG1_CRIGR|nr:hypothetical protein I79_012299 [Cricetulus griseus]
MWLLGIELRTSGRAASALNLCAISPAPSQLSYKTQDNLPKVEQTPVGWALPHQSSVSHRPK